MLKLIGGLMIWLGCAGWGVRAAGELGRYNRLLEDLVCALEQMEQELVLNRTTLPELLGRLGGRREKPSAELFIRCRKMIEQGNSFTYSWGYVLEEFGLEPEVRLCLEGLDNLLGRYDAEGQGQAVCRVRRELEGHAARAGARKRELTRVYLTAGVSAGVGLLLTLM